MRKIYVLDDNNQLVEIDAGVSQYAELTDAPILTKYNGKTLVGSTVSVEGGQMIIAEGDNHKWNEEEPNNELLIFCQNAESGRYDILTERFGMEILIVDKTNPEMENRYRRITVDQDLIYDEAAGWVSISDSSARELVFRISNQSEIPSTVVVGNRVALDCYYYSTVANGTITITKGEKTVAAANLESGKTTTILLTNEIADGINEFKIKVSNNNGKELYSSLMITGIKLSYNPNFNELQIRNGDVNFAFNYGGTGIKYVDFEITDANGDKFYYTSPNTYNGTGSDTVVLSASYFAHGENTINTYMYIKDGDDILTRTDTLTYVFPYVVETTEPIVMTYFDFTTLKEWDTVNVPYRIWLKDINTTHVDSIKLELLAYQESEVVSYVQEYNSDSSNYVNNYLTTNTLHNWQISNMPYGNLTFNIYLDGEAEPRYSKSDVVVAQSDYNFKTISGSLFNFAANDITDTKPFTTWKSGKTTMTLEGFNWTTDGIITETDKSLKYSTAAFSQLKDDYRLFSYVKSSGVGQGSSQEGLTLEFDFKVDDTADNSKPIIRYYDGDSTSMYGVVIYPTRAVFNYDTTVEDGKEQLTVNYQKGERTNITLTMEPTDSTTTEYFLKVYINGIVSSVIHYNSSATLACDSDTIDFNVSGNEFDLYAVRAYNRVLNSREVLQNYISNFASVDTKVGMLNSNNIYDLDRDDLSCENEKTGETHTLVGEKPVSFSKIKGKIGCLVIVADALPNSKAYVPCRTIFYEKDVNNPQVQWDDEHGRSMATTYYYDDEGNLNKTIKIGGQGTSSMEYPYKNFKLKFKDKFYIKGHDYGPDKTFTMKVD